MGEKKVNNLFDRPPVKVTLSQDAFISAERFSKNTWREMVEQNWPTDK